MRSDDAGQTWRSIGDGGVSREVAPIELPDGLIVAAGPDHLMTSNDRGDTWVPLGPPLPIAPLTMTYAPHRHAFYVAHSSCDNTVPADAIQELPVEAVR